MSTELQEKLEALTRQGKRGLVLECFKSIDRAKCSTDDLIMISKFANRNHFYSLALRFLYKEKQITEEQKNILSVDFVTTYSAALLGLGATEEAQKLLHTQLQHPPALFSFALSHFSTWNYASAIKYFKKYLDVQTDSYMILVGRLNLVAAYIGIGDYEKGHRLLMELMLDLKSEPRAIVLYGNSWEIKAQIEIENKNYTEALGSLEQAKSIFQNQLNRYLLYVNKWEAVAELAISPDSENAQKKLLAVKDQARTLRNWETVRDCDFQLARFTQNSTLMQHVLRGTPYPSYLKRVKMLYSYELDKAKEYILVPEGKKRSDVDISLDITNPPTSLVRQTNCLKLLRFLCYDFYKPSRVGVLHSHLHPNDYYNPFASPQRIKNYIFRLNKINADLKNGFEVKIEKGDIFLSNNFNLSIQIQTTKRKIEKEDYVLAVLISYFKGQKFNSLQASKLLGRSLRSTITVINYGVKKNKIKKVGTGKNTFYRLSNHQV